MGQHSNPHRNQALALTPPAAGPVRGNYCPLWWSSLDMTDWAKIKPPQSSISADRLNDRTRLQPYRVRVRVRVRARVLPRPSLPLLIMSWTQTLPRHNTAPHRAWRMNPSTCLSSVTLGLGHMTIPLGHGCFRIRIYSLQVRLNTWNRPIWAVGPTCPDPNITSTHSHTQNTW